MLSPIVEYIDIEAEGIRLGDFRNRQRRTMPHHFHEIVWKMSPSEFTLLVGGRHIVVHFADL